MKFRRAYLEDKARLETEWRRIFAHDDGGHSDFYFAHAYQANQSYLLCDDHDELISACQAHTKTLMLNEKPLQVSLIVGVFTVEKYRNQGYMHQLLSQVLDILKHRDLITLIQAYNPDVYLKYGFEPIYHRNHFTLQPKQIPVISPKGVNSLVSASDLCALYERFTAHFTGYARRTEKDFQLLQQEVASQKGQILGVYDENRLEAYGVVLFEHNTVVLDEVVYTSAKSLVKLLNALSNLNQSIELRVSEKESLQKIFPQAQVQPEVYTFAKLNDPKLFNELFKSNVKSASEAFFLAEKPLWFRENQ